MAEIVLPRRVVPQPTPFLVSGGDCGACVLGGLFGLSVLEAYERFVVGPRRHPTPTAIHWPWMRDMLREASDAAVLDPPIWPIDAEWMTFGLDGMNQYGRWQRYVRMALEAGYYGVVNVDLQGRGSWCHGGNHWALVCGWRPDSTGKTVIDEVLLSCSARHPAGQWVSTRDFLQARGGFNVLLARPKAG